jgi:phage-related protein
LIQNHGLASSGVVHRKLKGNLWELKIDAQQVVYVVLTGPAMVLLHAFRKQSQKTPKSEILTAETRLKDVQLATRRRDEDQQAYRIELQRVHRGRKEARP